MLFDAKDEFLVTTPTVKNSHVKTDLKKNRHIISLTFTSKDQTQI